MPGLLDLKLALQLSINAEANYEAYETTIKELTTHKEQLEALHLEQSSLNDLFNYSAMIVLFF